MDNISISLSSDNLELLVSDVFNDILNIIIDRIPTFPETLKIPREKAVHYCCFKRLHRISVNDNSMCSMCPICLVNFKNNNTVIKSNNCSHLFHYKCLKKWMKFKNSCPVCRNTCSFD